MAAEKTPEQIAKENFERFDFCYNAGHDKYVKRALRNDSFYMGDQWDEADRARLEAEGRPALTLNMILSTVNAMIGEQLDRKVEAVHRAGDSGNEQTAFALNKVAAAILSANAFDDIEESVFADGVIGGRGFFDVRLSFEKNIRGDVAISLEDPTDIIIDAQAKESDPDTWNEVFISRWMTLDEIADEYGEKKAEEISRRVDVGNHLNDNNFEYEDRRFGEDQPQTNNSGDEAKQIHRVRVVERQYYKRGKQKVYVDMETGAMRPVHPTKSDEEIEQFAEQNGFEIMEQKARRVRMTISVDDVLLYDDWSIYRSFTIVPFFPYFRRGNPFSPVDNLIDPQNLLNKTSSQELHIVNTTANSGWIVQEGSLIDMEVEDLEERGAETGLVLQYRRGYEEPKKIQPNQIPSGIDRISQKAANTIREVSSISSSMLGTVRADQSGRAQEAAIGRGQVQVSVVLSNLKRARRLVLRKILELVQDFYSETRYFKVLGESMLLAQGTQEEVGINVPTDDGNILNDVSVGDYSVEVGFRPAGGSLSDKEFEEAIRLREMGVAIPDHVVVQYSNLTKRQEVAEFLKNAQGFGEPTEEQAALQDLQMEHQIGMLQKELEKADADIELVSATALEKMRKAESLEDFNQARMQLAQMQNDRDLKEKELSLRIALAARGHQNQSSMNNNRLKAQVAMKSMDMVIGREKQKESSNKPSTNQQNKDK